MDTRNADDPRFIPRFRYVAYEAQVVNQRLKSYSQTLTQTLAQQDSDERKHLKIFRKTLLALFELSLTRPETFPNGLRLWLKSETGTQFSRCERELRCARMERDLGIPCGSFTFWTLKPLFFAKVYTPTKMGMGNSKRKVEKDALGVYGTIRNASRLPYQREAFALACSKAKVQDVAIHASRLEQKHVNAAVREVKRAYPTVFTPTPVPASPNPHVSPTEDPNRQLEALRQAYSELEDTYKRSLQLNLAYIRLLRLN